MPNPKIWPNDDRTHVTERSEHELAARTANAGARNQPAGPKNGAPTPTGKSNGNSATGTLAVNRYKTLLVIVSTQSLSWYDYIGCAMSLGTATGISINTAHELGHKNNRFERWLAKITLAPVAYGHFFVEHNRGHHVRVATLDDPASARYGESFWAFLPRTVTGSVRSAWRLEKARLARTGHSCWSWRNEVLHAWATTAA